MATSAITSTDAIASDATTRSIPTAARTATIDFVSSSMKPAPSRKKCHDAISRSGRARREAATSRAPRGRTRRSTIRQRGEVVARQVAIAQVEERPVVGGRRDRRVARCSRAGLGSCDWPYAVTRSGTGGARSAPRAAAPPASRRDTRAPGARARAAPGRTRRRPCWPADRPATSRGSSCRRPSRRPASGDRGPRGTIPR